MSAKSNLLNLSVFIICKNEAKIIGPTLAKAQSVADEIIIVDSGSTDETLPIAKKFTNKIYHKKWLGYARQKNYALSLCSNKWVLSLDADEVLSDALINEIKLYMKTHNAEDYIGFKTPRELFIGEKCVKFGGYYPDYQLRLFQKPYGRFKDLPVHEYVEIIKSNHEHIAPKNKIAHFKNPIKHYSYQSVKEYKKAYMKFAGLFPKKINPIFAFVKAIYSFFYRWVIRAGFLNGKIGAQLALIYAVYTFKKYR